MQQVINCIYVAMLWWLILEWRERQREDTEIEEKARRELKPRSPRQCMECRWERIVKAIAGGEAPRPWREVKSKRGRPKTHDSEGQACMDPTCPYYKITSADVHALRWDGVSNAREGTDSWECGYCGSKHTERLGTPLYRLKTDSDRVALAIHMSMKGMSSADIGEILKHSDQTIRRWIERSGRHSERLHNKMFRDMRVQHVQLDELVGKIRRGGKQVWVWTAQDAVSKLLLAWHVGGRKLSDAFRLIHRVKRRLAAACIPAFTSDGLNHYFYALTAHFGHWGNPKRWWHWHVSPRLLYGQLRKLRARRKLKATHTAVLCGDPSDMEAVLQSTGLTGKIQTSFVERLNLTLRHIVAGLRRRTWDLPFNPRSLRWQVSLGAAYYNFCRTHAALKIDMGTGYSRGRTPAMAAGITGHQWTVREFIMHPVY